MGAGELRKIIDRHIVDTGCAFIGFHPFSGPLQIIPGQYPFQQVDIWIGRLHDVPRMHSTGRLRCVMRTHGVSFPFSVFGPSPCPGHYSGRWATMASADFCPITRQVALQGAMRVLLVLLPIVCSYPATTTGYAGTLVLRWSLPGSFTRQISSQVGQISPDKNVNFRCTTAAFTLSPESGASLCCANSPGDWALYAISVRRLTVLPEASFGRSLTVPPLPSANVYVHVSRH